MTRRSVHAEGYSHQTAIPTGSRVGPLLASSIIVGFDPGTRSMPEAADDQLRNVLRHAGAIIAAGGATWDDVVKMTFHVATGDVRDVVERQWVELFPDADNRPARHTQVVDLPRKVLVQADFLAYVEG